MSGVRRYGDRSCARKHCQELERLQLKEQTKFQGAFLGPRREPMLDNRRRRLVT
jgi:hypothetical protein